MLDKKAVTPQITRATNARTFAGRGFSLFLGLNKSAEELGIKSHNYFIYDTADSVKQYNLMRKVRHQPRSGYRLPEQCVPGLFT